MKCTEKVLHKSVLVHDIHRPIEHHLRMSLKTVSPTDTIETCLKVINQFIFRENAATSNFIHLSNIKIQQTVGYISKNW